MIFDSFRNFPPWENVNKRDRLSHESHDSHDHEPPPPATRTTTRTVKHWKTDSAFALPQLGDGALHVSI